MLDESSGPAGWPSHIPQNAKRAKIRDNVDRKVPLSQEGGFRRDLRGRLSFPRKATIWHKTNELKRRSRRKGLTQGGTGLALCWTANSRGKLVERVPGACEGSSQTFGERAARNRGNDSKRRNKHVGGQADPEETLVDPSFNRDRRVFARGGRDHVPAKEIHFANAGVGGSADHFS